MQKLEEWNQCPLQSNSLDSEAMHCSLSFACFRRLQTSNPTLLFSTYTNLYIHTLALGHIVN